MSHTEQIEAFAGDLDALIKRYRSEFDLPLSTALGVLEFMKLRLYQQELIDPPRAPEDDED